MPYGSDRVGYGNCVPSREETRKDEIKTQELERMIILKNKPHWHLTDSEKQDLIKYYGLN